MKTTKGVPLNVTMQESIARLLLIIPAGGLGVLGVILFNTYVLVPIPMYLLATSLTSYCPLKHLYRVIMHRPVFTAANDTILSSEVM